MAIPMTALVLFMAQNSRRFEDQDEDDQGKAQKMSGLRAEEGTAEGIDEPQDEGSDDTPVMLPRPPRMMMMKALSIGVSPLVGLME
jgi:hypothetical protein